MATLADSVPTLNGKSSFKNSLYPAIYLGLATASITRLTFLLFGKSAIPYRNVAVSVNVTSAALGVFAGGGGFLYQWNREIVRLLEPTQAIVYPSISYAISNPVYATKINNVKDSVERAKLKLAYRIILNDILSNEFGISVKGERVDNYEIVESISRVKDNQSFRVNNTYKGEVLAGCLFGWILSPVIGGMLVNTAVGIGLGTIVFFANQSYIKYSENKLVSFLYEQRVEQLVKEKIITHEERDMLLRINYHYLSGNSTKEVFKRLIFSTVDMVMRAFPVLVKTTPEEIFQKDYMKQLGREYDDWIKERRIQGVRTIEALEKE